jgi:hypothetical protein
VPWGAEWGVDSLMAALGAPFADSDDVFAEMYKSAAARYLGFRFSRVATRDDAIDGSPWRFPRAR